MVNAPSYRSTCIVLYDMLRYGMVGHDVTLSDQNGSTLKTKPTSPARHTHAFKGM